MFTARPSHAENRPGPGCMRKLRSRSPGLRSWRSKLWGGACEIVDPPTQSGPLSQSFARHGPGPGISISTFPGRHRARIPGIWPELWWISVSSGVPTTCDYRESWEFQRKRLSTKVTARFSDARNPCPMTARKGGYGYFPAPAPAQSPTPSYSPHHSHASANLVLGITSGVINLN